jgi:hypothetical protein
MSSSSKTTTTDSIPAWLEAGSEKAVGIASDIADRPYTPYEEQRIADLSEGERVAGERALEFGQDYQSDLERSRELTEQGVTAFTDADMEGYMSPYISGALDPAARELREEMARQQAQIGGQAGMVGAFGGGRQAIAEAESRRGGLEAMSDLYGRGYQQAFESARDQFNRDRDVFARGAEQFRATGQAGQQMLGQDIQNLLTTGGVKRQLEQAGLDFDYGQFIEARDWDVNNLKPLLDTLSTVPHTKTRTEKQKKGALGTILGVAATVAGAYFTGGASLMAAGQTGGFLKKVGVGFGEQMGGKGAGMAAFGDSLSFGQGEVGAGGAAPQQPYNWGTGGVAPPVYA